MQAGERLSLEQIRACLEASDEVRFEGRNREEVYSWVEQILWQQGYRDLKRAGRGLVRRYLEKTTGLSRAQVTRLIRLYLGGEPVQPKRYRRRRFPTCYTPADIELLASLDEAHETLSGPATVRLLQRACYDFGEEGYGRLAQLSVAHLYRLRRTRAYRQRRIDYQPTRPTAVAIGERRAPQPEGRPGYLRVDTVHQGDLDGIKGVYHINAVDEVTQWEVLGATAQISEAWLLPVLEAMLAQFPFRIRGFQRQRVHQPHRGQAAQQAAGGADQVAAPALQRQWPGGVQERRGSEEAHGLRAHCGAACRGDHGVLPTALQSVSEFPSALRSARTGGGREGQSEEGLPLVRHAVGNPAAAAVEMQEAKRKLFARFYRRRSA